MKLSVSLPDEDIEFLDAYAKAQGIPSRSAVMLKAVRLLRSTSLGPSYEDAWREWSESGEQAVWESALDDGIG
mgnify:CR=1 FL=1